MSKTKKRKNLIHFSSSRSWEDTRDGVIRDIEGRKYAIDQVEIDLDFQNYGESPLCKSHAQIITDTDDLFAIDPPDERTCGRHGCDDAAEFIYCFERRI